MLDLLLGFPWICGISHGLLIKTLINQWKAAALSSGMKESHGFSMILTTVSGLERGFEEAARAFDRLKDNPLVNGLDYPLLLRVLR